MKILIQSIIMTLSVLAVCSCKNTSAEKMISDKPNIIIIYADDLGYGDVSCYGAKSVTTPEIDRLAKEGIKFTNAYATSATCTPSRYGLLTGEYPWRKPGTQIAKGNAAMIINPGTTTLPSVLKAEGYSTGVVGKWHLGLGPDGGPDWNGEIRPGPEEIGFDYAFLIPATGDRVPCVYVENRRIVGLDPSDPVKVDYDNPIGDEPIGRENPELLKMKFNFRHDQAIVNGISRLGYMTGGNAALWRDEDMADVITERALNFIDNHQGNPFFLYFSTHDIHVPRVPHERFAGQNEMGPRGDVIIQLDWCVGEIMRKLEELKITEKTIVIFSSDNGPVIDDGYHDQSVERLGDHKPAGPFRGAKYSAFEGGPRIPFIVHWPGKVLPGISDARISQVDLLASLASLAGNEKPDSLTVDSQNQLAVLLGKSKEGRQILVLQNAQSTLSVIKNDWKYIEPSDRFEINTHTTPHIELGNHPLPQLYNLRDDISESKNVAELYPEKVRELSEILTGIKQIEQ
jgi:arylsulfatase A-like enzyme